MLSQFPEFKCLTWADKEDIEQFTREFQPYSDFNFTSLYAWNINDKMRISELNGNLVVSFTDYLTDMPFLSFIGNNALSETACELLAYSEKQFNECALKLIPEQVAQSLCPKLFTITPDRDAYDYIYSASDLSNLYVMSSNKCNAARLNRHFLNHNPNHDCSYQTLATADTDALRDMYRLWANNKQIKHFVTNEYLAFERLLRSPSDNVLCISMHIDGILKGFALLELLSADYAIAHFSKADMSHKGIYEAILWHVGKVLSEKKIPYLNFEQDLGIENLRRAKSKYIIHGFLKKYTVIKLLL